VDTTIIDGQVVMSGRVLQTVDEELVCAKANEAFSAVLGRMVVPSPAPTAPTPPEP
jgi:hypothetical protein